MRTHVGQYTYNFTHPKKATFLVRLRVRDSSSPAGNARLEHPRYLKCRVCCSVQAGPA